MMTLWSLAVVCLALNMNSAVCFEKNLNSSGSYQTIRAIQQSSLQNAIVLDLQLTITRNMSEGRLELVSSHYLLRDMAAPLSVLFHPQLHQFSVIMYKTSGRQHVETFYYDLEVEAVNRVTLVLADHQLVIYVNCSLVYDRHIGSVNLGLLRTHTQLYDASFLSRPLHSSRLVESKVLVGFEERSWKRLCYQPLQHHVLRSCALADERTSLVEKLQSDLQSCSNNISVAVRDKRSLITELSKWQGCECSRPCWHNGKKRIEGSKWQTRYETCICSNGTTHCRCRVSKCWDSESLFRVKGHRCPRCFSMLNKYQCILLVGNKRERKCVCVCVCVCVCACRKMQGGRQRIPTFILAKGFINKELSMPERRLGKLHGGDRPSTRYSLSKLFESTWLLPGSLLQL